MKAIVVTDETAGTAGTTLVELRTNIGNARKAPPINQQSSTQQ